MTGRDPAAITRGSHRLAEAVRVGELDQAERDALSEILAVLAAAERLDAGRSVNLPALAGGLISLVDTYRAAVERIGGER